MLLQKKTLFLTILISFLNTSREPVFVNDSLQRFHLWGVGAILGLRVECKRHHQGEDCFLHGHWGLATALLENAMTISVKQLLEVGHLALQLLTLVGIGDEHAMGRHLDNLGG